jgi:hypothetical protein
MMRERMKNFDLMQEPELTAPWVAVTHPLDPVPVLKAHRWSKRFGLSRRFRPFEWSSRDPQLASNSTLFAAMPLPSHSQSPRLCLKYARQRPVPGGAMPNGGARQKQMHTKMER